MIRAVASMRGVSGGRLSGRQPTILTVVGNGPGGSRLNRCARAGRASAGRWRDRSRGRRRRTNSKRAGLPSLPTSQASTYDRPRTLHWSPWITKRGPLVDPQADQVRPVGEDAQQAVDAAPPQEMLVDDRVGDEAEAAADVGLGVAPLDHHVGHHRRAGGGPADHAAALEQGPELALDGRPAIGRDQLDLVAAAEPDGRGLGDRPGERRVVGLLARAGMEQHERGRLILPPGLEVAFFLRLAVGRLAGRRDDHDPRRLAAGQRQEFVADAVRHPAPADDHQRPGLRRLLGPQARLDGIRAIRTTSAAFDPMRMARLPAG